MSKWTYVNGIINVDVVCGRTQAECRYILETVLNHLPVVSGSEENMNWYIVQHKAKNTFSSHNEFGEYKKDGCDYTTNYTVVVSGSLRDREIEQTYREFVKWLTRLAKRIWVENVIVKIDDGWGSEKVVNLSDLYEIQEEYSWEKNSGGEPAWVEHLLWEGSKTDRQYPLKLMYKYYEDEETDNEIEGRRRRGYR